MEISQAQPDLRQEREPLVTLTLSELQQIIRAEVEGAFGALKTSSAEITRNAKGERTVSIKQYDVSAAAAYDAASRVYDRAVRELLALGTDTSPAAPLGGDGAGLRSERR